MIDGRLDEVLGPTRWQPLSSSVRERLPRLLAAIGPGGAYELTECLRVADLDRGDVLRWFRTLGVSGTVEALWVADGSGGRLQVEAFFEHHDELWLPGADDVLVVPDDEAWILVLDHEERLAVHRRDHAREVG